MTKTDKPKGGRGNGAPYKTKLMRVPVDLDAQVQILIDRYREWKYDDANKDNPAPPPLLLDNLVNDFTQTDKPVNKISETGEEILERLKKGEEVTEKEVAKFLGVSQKAVNDASKKGNEHFTSWSMTKCGLELQCRDLNAGSLDGKNRKLRYSLALSDKPSC